ncbi:hypothetical protein HAX54_001244 [Datura stramonium]|uniref:Uncharacterized protein n=1 Tax=Datura stramonium TaxID=4076 RepID=A0ABS8T375_DATST|nr:hypothetical protein [Datura stramonium]
MAEEAPPSTQGELPSTASETAQDGSYHQFAQKHQKATGPLRLRPCLEKVKVRGVEVLDITKIQDEMNHKLRKRKREPVVAHISEIEMGIESQVQHSQAAEAQPSTSDSTPIAPQSAQPLALKTT